MVGIPAAGSKGANGDQHLFTTGRTGSFAERYYNRSQLIRTACLFY